MPENYPIYLFSRPYTNDPQLAHHEGPSVYLTSDILNFQIKSGQLIQFNLTEITLTEWTTLYFECKNNKIGLNVNFL